MSLNQLLSSQLDIKVRSVSATNCPAYTDVVIDTDGKLVSSLPTTVNIPLDGSTFATARVGFVAGVRTLVVTCPADKYLVLGAATYNADAGGLGKVYVSPDGGITHYFIATASVTAGTVASVPISNIMIRPGWSVWVESTAGACQLMQPYYLMPTDGLMQPLLLEMTLAAGDQTIYTCPADKKTSFISTAWSATSGSIRISSRTGSGFTAITSLQAVDASLWMFGNATVATAPAFNTVSGQSFVIQPSQSLVLNVSAPGAGANVLIWSMLAIWPLASFP